MKMEQALCKGIDCKDRTRKVQRQGLCYTCFEKKRLSRSPEEQTLSKASFGWNRYSGKEILFTPLKNGEAWICQSCADDQPSQLPRYLLYFDADTIVRICPLCQHEVCVRKLTLFKDLIRLVR